VWPRATDKLPFLLFGEKEREIYGLGWAGIEERGLWEIFAAGLHGVVLASLKNCICAFRVWERVTAMDLSQMALESQ
jgi:hypothetical protein